MKRSDEISALAAALSKFQGALPPIPKTRTGVNGEGEEYLYSDLSDIMPIVGPVLADSALAVLTEVATVPAGVSVTALLMHESGQWIQTEPLVLFCNAHPHSIGSAATYGRRYTVSALLGLAPEEDDDAAGVKPPASTQPRSAGAKTDDAKPATPKKPTASQIRALWGKAKAAGFEDEAAYVADLEQRLGKNAHPDTITREQASAELDHLATLITAQTQAAKKQKAGE